MDKPQDRPWHKKWRYRLPIAAVTGITLLGALGDSPEPAVMDTVVPAPIVQDLAPAAPQEEQKEAVVEQEAEIQTEVKISEPAPASAPQKPAPKEGNCNPNYSGCLKVDASDYDCAGGSGNGPYYTGKVQVIGDDQYDLDRDGDGWACE